MTEKTESIDKLPLRGMRDFLPKDWIFRKKLMSAWIEAAEENGFVRYETPIVEPLSLLERKAGEEISEQIYNFEDKSGRKIALRPELTPSMVRIVAGNRDSFTAQGKVYSIGQCFRYERASLGRKREHFQWNIDIVGEEKCVAEAYLLKTAVVALQKIGFSAVDFQIHINNRQLVTDFLTSIGIEGENALAVMGVMDKKDKVSPIVFADMLHEINVIDKQIQSILDFMNARSLEEIEALGLAEAKGILDMKSFLLACDALGIRDYIMIDPAIVRGLAYYTGIVFEAFDINRKFRAIFGGGRYNNLFEKLTGRSTEACGLGFGDVVIEELYKAKYPNIQTIPTVDVIIGGYSSDIIENILKLSTILTDTGISVDCDFKASQPGKFMGRANKRNAKIAVYIGEQEAENNQVLIKNMQTGEQVVVLTDDFKDALINTLK